MTILKITVKKTTGNTPIVFSYTKYSICNIIATTKLRKFLKVAYLSHFLNLIHQVFFLDELLFVLLYLVLSLLIYALFPNKVLLS